MRLGVVSTNIQGEPRKQTELLLQEKVKSNWKNLPLIWTVCPLAWCKLVSGSIGLSMIVSLIHANAICFYIHVQHYLECDRHVTVVQDMALVV